MLWISLRCDERAAIVTVGSSYPGEKDSHVVVYLCYGADSGTGALADGFLGDCY